MRLGILGPGKNRQEARDADEMAHIRTIRRYIADGFLEEAEAALVKYLTDYPATISRIFAASVYRRLGQPEEARRQLLIGLALDPNNYGIHRVLGLECWRRGEEKLANAIWMQGWRSYKKALPKKDWEVARARYFAPPKSNTKLEPEEMDA